MVTKLGYPSCFIAFSKLDNFPLNPFEFVPNIDKLRFFMPFFLFDLPLLFLFFFFEISTFNTSLLHFPILAGFASVAFVAFVAS